MVEHSAKTNTQTSHEKTAQKSKQDAETIPGPYGGAVQAASTLSQEEGLPDGMKTPYNPATAPKTTEQHPKRAKTSKEEANETNETILEESSFTTTESSDSDEGGLDDESSTEERMKRFVQEETPSKKQPDESSASTSDLSEDSVS